MSDKSYFKDVQDENSVEKFSRKAKDSPFMLLGIGGCLAACAVGAYKFKHRGNMSISVFLMQMRVIAQGTVVGCLTLGLGYTMTKEYLLDKKE